MLSFRSTCYEELLKRRMMDRSPVVMMSQKQKEICDYYAIIPQHGVGTASLNVAVAATIVFHHFAVWAEYGDWR